MKPGGIYSDPIPLIQYLSDVGDGSGNVNANGDYTTPDMFFIQPAADEIMEIEKLIIHITDGGVLAIGSYGALSALTNGIEILVTNEGSISRSIVPEVLKTNGDLLHLGPDSSIYNFTSSIDAIIATLDFGNKPLILDGSQGHKIEVLLSDNLTGLSDHHFIAHGFK